MSDQSWLEVCLVFYFPNRGAVIYEPNNPAMNDPQNLEQIGYR